MFIPVTFRSRILKISSVNFQFFFLFNRRFIRFLNFAIFSSVVREQSTHFRKLHKNNRSQYCGQMRMRKIFIGSSLGNEKHAKKVGFFLNSLSFAHLYDKTFSQINTELF